MITLIEAHNYRCLQYIRQSLGPFHVLIGPNASGKSTFLDVVAFLSEFVSGGLEQALASRTSNFKDLVWGRSGDRFELAVEVRIPDEYREKLNDSEFRFFRYEVAIGLDPDSGEARIFYEVGLLKKHATDDPRAELLLFPAQRVPPKTLITPRAGKDARLTFTKKPGQNDNYYSEAYPVAGKGWVPAFKLGPRRSTLANLPEDESRFPVSTWFKEFLSAGVQNIVLNSLLIRKASPPGQVRGFKPDGSNLPWVIHNLERQDASRLKDWVAHLRTALPDLRTVRIVEREDDRHRYLMLGYDTGIEVPSWMASDGTLRLMALTLPAYVPDFSGVYLIEEPENGIHPAAVQTMFDSLSSVYDAQIMLATHSPVILSIVEAKDVLCFAKTDDGATDIVSGSDHPKLKDWNRDREENLGVLFAAGLLS